MIYSMLHCELDELHLFHSDIEKFDGVVLGDFYQSAHAIELMKRKMLKYIKR